MLLALLWINGDNDKPNDHDDLNVHQDGDAHNTYAVDAVDADDADDNRS